MTTDLVLTTNHGAVRVLTLNRPAARNALSRDLIRATYAALTDADANESVRAVVLTGADPAFCAGVDLKEAQRDGLKYFEEFRSQSCIPRSPRCEHRSSERSMARHSPAGWRWRWAATSSWRRNGRCSPTRTPGSASCRVVA